VGSTRCPGHGHGGLDRLLIKPAGGPSVVENETDDLMSGAPVPSLY
jgi:hypothetical protein